MQTSVVLGFVLELVITIPGTFTSVFACSAVSVRIDWVFWLLRKMIWKSDTDDCERRSRFSAVRDIFRASLAPSSKNPMNSLGRV
jgi:hypothetical protein